MSTKHFAGVGPIIGTMILFHPLLNANLRADPPQYTVTMISTAGESTAVGINNHGQVAGNSGATGFLYTPDVGVTGIGALGNGGSTAFGLNDLGQVVGKSGSVYLSGVYDHAFIYTPGQGMVDIQGPGAYQSEAWDINNNGEVTGYRYTGFGGSVEGYLYSTDTQALAFVKAVVGISASTTRVYGINDRNEVAGQIYGGAMSISPDVDPLTDEVLLYHTLFPPRITPSGAGIPGTVVSSGQDINDNGIVVGFVEPLNDYAMAFLGGGAVVNIGGLSDSIHSTAESINNAGQIVGNSVSASFVSHGFVHIEGVNYDLNDVIEAGLGITGIRVGARPDVINEWGQIAAYGNVAGVGQRALILNPTTPITSGLSFLVPDRLTRTTKFVAGIAFDKFIPTTNPLAGSLGTTVDLLDGTAGANRDVKIGFDGSGSFGGLASDVVTVSGTAADIFVLQITYDEALAISFFGSEVNAYLSWRDPIDSVWKNAVLGNSGGAPVPHIGAYDRLLHFHLGYYGVDTATNTVWAVLNHNSDFAVTGFSSVPEPATVSLVLCICSLTAAMRSLHRRRFNFVHDRRRGQE